MERRTGIGTGEKEGNMDWGEYGLEGGREYEFERMRGKGIEELERIKGMGVERRKEIRIGEDEGKREWREGQAKGLERRKERSQIAQLDGERERASRLLILAVTSQYRAAVAWMAFWQQGHCWRPKRWQLRPLQWSL